MPKINISASLIADRLLCPLLRLVLLSKFQVRWRQACPRMSFMDRHLRKEEVTFLVATTPATV